MDRHPRLLGLRPDHAAAGALRAGRRDAGAGRGLAQRLVVDGGSVVSTYWGYVCESHDPPIISEHWMNHGDERLAVLFWTERRDGWPSDPSITAWDEPVPVPYYDGADAYASTVPIVWLREHPHCRIALHNEYGDRRDIEAEGPAS